LGGGVNPLASKLPSLSFKNYLNCSHERASLFVKKFPRLMMNRDQRTGTPDKLAGSD
jgi:hypothetical protein